jgi:GTPase
VADYPFTTLQPVLGTVESPDGRQLVVADVPGLIEGASEGIGLGHDFLAHLERARTLVHVIDASKDADEQWRTIDAELVAYGAGLELRPQIVILNKIDLEPDPVFGVEDERIVGVLRLSCATGQGLEEFRRALFALVPVPVAESVAPDELPEFLVYRPEPKARPWRLFRTERGFRVVGTPPGEEELERALRAAGAKRGAAVEIGEETLELA